MSWLARHKFVAAMWAFTLAALALSFVFRARVKALKEAETLERATTETILASERGLGTFVIHAPAIGCGRGWKKAISAFVSHGHPSDACVRGSGQPVQMDYLMPGETLKTTILIPVEEERPAPGGDSD